MAKNKQDKATPEAAARQHFLHLDTKQTESGCLHCTQLGGGCCHGKFKWSYIVFLSAHSKSVSPLPCLYTFLFLPHIVSSCLYAFVYHSLTLSLYICDSVYCYVYILPMSLPLSSSFSLSLSLSSRCVLIYIPRCLYQLYLFDFVYLLFILFLTLSLFICLHI